jgi:hypothetical protein
VSGMHVCIFRSFRLVFLSPSPYISVHHQWLNGRAVAIQDFPELSSEKSCIERKKRLFGWLINKK